MDDDDFELLLTLLVVIGLTIAVASDAVVLIVVIVVRRLSPLSSRTFSDLFSSFTVPSYAFRPLLIASCSD